MCGIAGHWSIHSHLEEAQLKSRVNKMCLAIKHRGPDGSGIYVDGTVNLALGHQRLSVVDIETGQQPICNKQKNIWLVFNGEIYNYKDLRVILQNKGYKFDTKSDSEVIVYAYQEWGENCVNHFNGMFAFTIWDQNQRQLFSARDPIGIKPFYFYWNHVDFIFCSELKGIVANSSFEKKINYDLMGSYLQTGYSAGPQSWFHDVQKLPAGHALTIKDGQCTIKQYWSITNTGQEGEIPSFDDASKVLSEKLIGAVEAQLVSDVPIGAFLSGGVDSSAVVTMMSKIMDDPVMTHCVGFSSKKFDEREYAQSISKLMGTDHCESQVEIDVGEKLDEIIWHMDEPFADSSCIPTYYVCEAARKRVTVCLSGDGGDELFSGYNWYAELARLSRIDNSVPEWIRRNLFGVKFEKAPYLLRGATFLKNIGLSPAARHENLVSLFGMQHIRRLLSDDFKSEIVVGPHPICSKYSAMPGDIGDVKAAQLADLQTYLVDDILTKVDRMSMAHSLEVRVPMLDHNVVEFAFLQPTKYMMQGRHRKLLLKSTMSGLIPEHILDRKKQGFSAPLRSWLLGDLKERMGDLLLSSSTSQSGVFKTREVSKLWDQFQNQGCRIDLSHHIWTLLCYEMWHQQYA